MLVKTTVILTILDVEKLIKDYVSNNVRPWNDIEDIEVNFNKETLTFEAIQKEEENHKI